MDWNFSDFSDITTLSRLVYIYDKCPLNVRHLRGLKSRKNGNFSPQLVASLWKMSLPLEISSWMGRGMHFFRMLQKYQAISAKKWQKKKKNVKKQTAQICLWTDGMVAFFTRICKETFKLDFSVSSSFCWFSTCTFCFLSVFFHPHQKSLFTSSECIQCATAAEADVLSKPGIYEGSFTAWLDLNTTLSRVLSLQSGLVNT